VNWIESPYSTFEGFFRDQVPSGCFAIKSNNNITVNDDRHHQQQSHQQSRQQKQQQQQQRNKTMKIDNEDYFFL
jgi:hypothetical protein